MKKAISLLFASLLFLSIPGCAKKVDKADDPVDGLVIEEPSLTDDEDDSSTTQAE